MDEHYEPDPAKRQRECPIAMQIPQLPIYSVPQFHAELLSYKTEKDLLNIIIRLASHTNLGYLNNFGPENWSKVFEEPKH